MKKGNLTLLVAGAILTGILLFSACNNILSPSAGAEPGKGNVTVSLSAGPSARTLMPSALDFDLYEFTFKNGSFNETFPREKGAGGLLSFSVPVGSGYTLGVKAYKVTGEARIPAAEGVSGSFSVSASTSVTVKLTGNLNPEEAGTFSYNVQYPANAGIMRFVLISRSGEINLLSGAAEIEAGAGKAMINSVELASGWYGMELDLGDGEKAAFDDDIVRIFSNTTTFYGTEAGPIVFAAGDFKTITPPPPVNVGVPAEGWHGFTIAGPSEYYSGALGTQYDSFTDAGGTCTDVLKVEPPSGHYEESTMALCYTIPTSGFYKLSMSIMAEVWPEKGIDIFWQEIDHWGTIAGSLDKIQGVQSGEWFFIGTGDPDGVFFNEGDRIALLVRQSSPNSSSPTNSPDNGLNDATIYIKDLKLEVNGAPIVDTSVADGHVYGVTISPSSFNITTGDVRQLSAQVYPSNALNKDVHWSSSAPGIAAVDQNGLVSAVAVGSAVITVTAADGGKTAKSFVTVNEEGWVEPKYLALTFDDGPDPNDGDYKSATTRLLGYLEDADVHATFFLVGNNVEKSPDIARAILAGGHDIGNHSLTHRADYYDVSNSSYNGSITKAAYKEELVATQDIIKNATGTTPVFFRPPHLCGSENLRLTAESMGFPIMHCMMFSDWDEGTSPETIYQRTIGAAYPWGIFLLHDNGPNCQNAVTAIPAILRNLKDEGFTVVSLSEMMALRKALYLEPGNIYGDFQNLPPDPAFPNDGVIVKATVISVSDTAVSLNAGETMQLTASIQPGNVTHSKVYWYSANDSVASVSSGGLVTANFRGTTTIRAGGGGQMASVTVTVTGASSNSWAAFNYSGSDYTAGPSGAVGAVGSWEGYSNVLKLALPADKAPQVGTVAMSYQLPAGGDCSLSMDVWVQKRSEQDIQIYWEESNTNAWRCISGNNDPVAEGVWFHVETPYPGSWNLPAGDIIYLLIKNGPGTGLKDAVLYIRDLKLEIGGQTVLNIPSGAYDPGTAFNENIFADAWALFDYDGRGYANSGAVGEVINFTDGLGAAYSNVLKLGLPDGTAPVAGTVAMTYKLPAGGNCTLSMWIWVEKRSYQEIQIQWQEVGGSWNYIATNSEEVVEGKWIHVVTPGGSGPFSAGTMIYLLTLNAPGAGFKDAVLYIRDMELTVNGERVIYCPGKLIP